MIGTQIGPFLVLRKLGAGGMGSVYLAEHSLMKDLHAIKVLDPQLTQNPQLVTRFVNEARAAAKLRHRNLVRVHNIERMPDDGPWFMVLDYLDGSTLGRFMATHRGPMAPQLILHILAQVANCIQHVHDHKIVHRDLKPDNIFLIQHDDDPQFPVVLDLGVAQLSEELASGPATKTGTVIGTPIYMAPEQLRGERVSPAADVFALGVIAYEMTTGGYFPYQYDEPRSGYFELPVTELYYRQRSAPPCDPRRRCAGLDDAWVNTLRAALDLDPRARPASARALAIMLAESVPAADGHPDGLAIVRRVARELIGDRGSNTELRPSRPAPVITSTPPTVPLRNSDRAGPRGTDPTRPEHTTVAEPVSTLNGAASQSVAGARAARRWGTIAGGGAAALLVGLVTTFAVIRWTVPASAQRSDSSAGVVPSASPGEPGPATPAPVTSAPLAVASAATPDREVRDAGTNPSPTAGGGGHVAAPRPEPARPAAASPPGAVGTARTSASPVTPATTPPPAAISAKQPAPTTSPSPAASPRPSTSTGASSHAQSSIPATTAKKTGELAIIVKPWALIWLNGKSLGQTPFRENVAAGRYRLRLVNDDVGKDETAVITVNPDQTTTIQRTW